MDVEFGEPPRPRAYVTIDHAEFIKALKEHPGKWAIIPRTYANTNSAHSMAHYIKTGRAKYAPKGAFEAAVRTEDGQVRVWVRYVGESAERAA